MAGRIATDLSSHTALSGIPDFDIIEWAPAYLSCQRYFLDHAQYEPGTQALCSLINIRLPFQWLTAPILSSAIPSPTPATASPSRAYPFGRPAINIQSPGHVARSATPPHVSLVPYLRRLVVTGFDKPAILHGLFGDDYTRGVIPHLDCERRNYLFAAKAGGWVSCKQLYDGGSGGGGDETLPFMEPLRAANIGELTTAEKTWNAWQTMEDWQFGSEAAMPQQQPQPRGNPWPSASYSAGSGLPPIIQQPMMR